MKLKTHTGIVIEESDWSDFVSKVYKRPYRLQQQDGCMNRGVLRISVPDEYFEDDDEEDGNMIREALHAEEIGVSFRDWLKRDPKHPLAATGNGSEQWVIDLWWHRRFYPTLGVVANDLHKKGLLPAGEYTIIIEY